VAGHRLAPVEPLRPGDPREQLGAQGRLRRQADRDDPFRPLERERFLVAAQRAARRVGRGRAEGGRRQRARRRSCEPRDEP
jgi:hypothetical protein